MKETVTRFLGWLLWGLIEGSSVVINPGQGSGRVIKIQQPRIFVRMLNFLAFQRWAPLYEREIGLQIATCRREIAHFVLLCGGVRCRVAPCLGIESLDGRLALVTQLVEGRQPDREEVISVSREVTTLFLHAGLSVWPVCTFHPRFHTNFVIDGEGVPWIVDLESHVPSIFVPFEELWDNLLIGNFPPFDDIHFPKLWEFYREESVRLSGKAGERFRICIEECEKLTRRQKSGELRIWSRILGVLLRAKRPLLRRYGIFFVVGAFVEASRLLCFAAILESQSALVANVLSLLFRIVIAFVFHATITWRDRPGNFGVKFTKFAINQGITSGVKTVMFPLWLSILPCPLSALANQILGIFRGMVLTGFLSRIITCEFLSVATMDTAVYLTLGFFLHDRISFTADRE